jgi:nucleoside-diphosphate-sugar epimerase
MATGSLFCFGLGYSALRLARRLRREGWDIAGTAREPPTAPGEFTLQRFATENPLRDPQRALAGTTHVLISVPPHQAGCPVYAAHGADLAAVSTLRWIGYLSTTSVYGDRAGGWVDEDSALLPTGDRGAARIVAERQWLSLPRGDARAVAVFRLAGIYGPGRSVLDALAAGTARRIVKPGQAFSRIHVEDLAETVYRSMARPGPGGIYNVCDDEAAPQDEVVAYAASLLGVAPPPREDFAGADLSALARSFYDDNKRVSNRRIKDELGVVLRYPTYREGLAALSGAGASKS